MATITLSRSREPRLSEVHARYLSARIDHYREKAAQALKASRAAHNCGDPLQAQGQADAAAAYHAIAQGLADQQSTQGEAR